MTNMVMTIDICLVKPFHSAAVHSHADYQASFIEITSLGLETLLHAKVLNGRTTYGQQEGRPETIIPLPLKQLFRECIKYFCKQETV